MLPVWATPEGLADPVFSGLAWPRPTLQWHQDTFELPEGATLLAGSPAYPHQAFRVGAVAYGVQFHIEVDESMAAEWSRVPEYVASAAAVLGDGGLERLLAEFRAVNGGDAVGRTRTVRPLGGSLGLSAKTGQRPCHSVDSAASPV